MTRGATACASSTKIPCSPDVKNEKDYLTTSSVRLYAFLHRSRSKRHGRSDQTRRTGLVASGLDQGRSIVVARRALETVESSGLECRRRQRFQSRVGAQLWNQRHRNQRTRNDRNPVSGRFDQQTRRGDGSAETRAAGKDRPRRKHQQQARHLETSRQRIDREEESHARESAESHRRSDGSWFSGLRRRREDSNAFASARRN